MNSSQISKGNEGEEEEKRKAKQTKKAPLERRAQTAKTLRRFLKIGGDAKTQNTLPFLFLVPSRSLPLFHEK